MVLMRVGFCFLFLAGCSDGLTLRNPDVLKRSMFSLLAPHGIPASNLPTNVALKIDKVSRDLESVNPTAEPASTNARSAHGTWRVMYSTAPPPSNGRIGPFKGEAFQIVDVDTGRYRRLWPTENTGLRANVPGMKIVFASSKEG